VTEQAYKAVQGVLADGRTVSEVAGDWGVCRRTMHRWLVRYEGEGLEGLSDHSHRPAHCPHRIRHRAEALARSSGGFCLGQSQFLELAITAEVIGSSSPRPTTPI
jgi:transposase